MPPTPALCCQPWLTPAAGMLVAAGCAQGRALTLAAVKSGTWLQVLLRKQTAAPRVTLKPGSRHQYPSVCSARRHAVHPLAGHCLVPRTARIAQAGVAAGQKTPRAIGVCGRALQATTHRVELHRRQAEGLCRALGLKHCGARSLCHGIGAGRQGNFGKGQRLELRTHRLRPLWLRCWLPVAAPALFLAAAADRPLIAAGRLLAAAAARLFAADATLFLAAAARFLIAAAASLIAAAASLLAAAAVRLLIAAAAGLLVAVAVLLFALRPPALHARAHHAGGQGDAPLQPREPQPRLLAQLPARHVTLCCWG